MKLEPRHQRPLRLVESVQQMIPDAWHGCDMWREHRGRAGFQDWPRWCYVPIELTMPIVMRERYLGPSTYEERLHASRLAVPIAGLSAWRVTQGIWDFDETLYRELWDSPLEGDLPVELFYRLPEWAPYICLRGELHDGVPLRGFFVWLEHDGITGRPELRLMLDSDATTSADQTSCLTLYLTSGTIEDSLRRVADNALRNLRELKPRLRSLDADVADWLADTSGLLKL